MCGEEWLGVDDKSIVVLYLPQGGSNNAALRFCVQARAPRGDSGSSLRDDSSAPQQTLEGRIEKEKEEAG